jgi:hypothetical protein
MIHSTIIEEQEKQQAKHFGSGRRRAVIGRVAKRTRAWARRCCSVAARKALGFASCFSEEIPGSGSADSQKESECRRVWLGSREVEVSRIVGSVGRCRDFDEDFRPLKRSLGRRWKGVYGAVVAGNLLPAVKLFKIEGKYFVEDGNHRVSVARHLGADLIDAEVTEILFSDAATITESDTDRG